MIRMEEVDPLKMARMSQVEGRRMRGRQRIRWRDGTERYEAVESGGRGCRRPKQQQLREAIQGKKKGG